MKPAGENLPGGAAKLPATGQHATAIDEGEETEGIGVLESQGFTGEFGRATKGRRGRSRETAQLLCQH
jgi:hypothetical protein